MDFLIYAAVFVLGLIAIYAAFRIAGAAWFRSKSEFYHQPGKDEHGPR